MSYAPPTSSSMILIGLTFAAQFAFATFLDIDLADYGAKNNLLIAHGEIWRLFTAIFLHGSVLHILFNAYALYYLGREIETFYGPLRFSLVFLVAGLSGSVVSMLLNPHASIGASGAIFGLIGAEGVFLYRNRRLLGERIIDGGREGYRLAPPEPWLIIVPLAPVATETERNGRSEPPSPIQR